MGAKGLVICPSCGAEMVRGYPDGKVKLRAKILIWDGGKCIGKCGRCGFDVPLLGLPAPGVKKNPVHVIFPR